MTRFTFTGLVVAALILAALTRSSGVEASVGVVAARIAPLTDLTYTLGQNIRGALATLTDRRNLRQENRSLTQEAARLTQENARLSLEAHRLSLALGVKRNQAPGIVAVASVIGSSSGGLYRRLFIAAGRDQGLSLGMPITSGAGLVGVVAELDAHQAVVRTIVDSQSRVGVQLAGQPGRGIAYGSPPDRLRVELPATSNPRVGELLLSGAIQGLFPEGIPVGRIVQVVLPAPGALQRVVIARPLVSFSLLEEVVVLKPL